MNRFVVRAVAVLVLALSPAAAMAQDAAELLVRVNRLEGQVRQLSGQIEQLQFQNRRLEEQLRKFQEDVEFRFQDLNKGTRPGVASGAATPPAAAPARPAPAPAAPPAAQPQKRGDAFDPSQQPNAPGAPRVLGSAGETATIARGPIQPGIEDIMADDEEPTGPLDLSRRAGGLPAPGLPSGALPAPALPAPPAAVPQTAGRQATAPTPVAVSGSGTARDDFDIAYGLVLQRQYDQAEQAFRQFLQTWPRDRMAPQATYWLGETYYRRGRYTDAIEQYLKVYKTFGSSPVAPDSLYKMALSLRGIGQPEQACATLAEVGRKYPSASAELKAGVDREQRRGNC
ncbi:tol-pal system protein YbgF [Alsobacter sp. R-9]